ncbi:hypothetical protein HZC31_03030 [Candidatus Woesearchaeota archaeon]|nr:hypothetical protein [Candidatus Woesearchaeota archaeon]
MLPHRLSTAAVVTQLRELYKGFPDNIFLRGSLARGERYDDIDISIYNPQEIVSEQLPVMFCGRPISYGRIPVEELDTFFYTSGRENSSLLDIIEIQSTGQARDIIQRQKEISRTEKAPYYLLFLELEEAYARLCFPKSDDSTYEYLKRMGGSKRTVSRILFAYRHLHVEHSEVRQTATLLEHLKEREILSEKVASGIDYILDKIFDDPLQTNPGRWYQETASLCSWFDAVLKPEIGIYVHERIGTTYPELIRAAFSSDAKSVAPLVEQALGDSSWKPYQTWIALFALTANTNLAPEDFLRIKNHIVHNRPYRPIIKNIIRNPSTPHSILHEIDRKIDPLIAELLDRRIATT